jgi:dCTP deaminase
MILSDQEIMKCLRNRSVIIEPFSSRCLGASGYDLRLHRTVTIPSGQFRLVATLERVELGDDIAGSLHIRSSLARSGIIASLALVDPGFRGLLTICLYNAGRKPFSMRRNDRFVQIVLHKLGRKAKRPYAGRYQDSQGVVHRRRETP